MRYRLHISGVEYFAAFFPCMDGIRLLLHPQNHSHNGVGYVWHLFYPYLLLSAPIILVVRYFYSYVELTPSSLEYREAWRHSSIPYGQIGKVVIGTKGGGLVGRTTTEIHSSGIKKISFKLEKTEDFVAELRQ